MNRHGRFGLVGWTMAVVMLLGVAVQAQPKRERPGAAPGVAPARTTMQVLADAMEAVRAGDNAKAAAIFETIKGKPDFVASRPPVSLFLAVGDHHFSLGTRDGQETALQVYGQAGDLYGDNIQPTDRAMLRLRRSEVMMRQGRIDAAREELAQIRRRPQSRRAMVYADLGDAEILLLANQPEAAREKLLTLVDVEDQAIAPLAMFQLGRAYVQLKQTDEAIITFRKLWNRYGENEMVKRAIFLVGQIYFDRGDFLEARKLFEACAVVGATMQTRVKPGDELIVKVYDANHYTRTRSSAINATLTAPSGDKEQLRLEKNPVNDQMYVGRVRTVLAEAAGGDGVLQVGGGDVIEISYGQTAKPHKVRVVDDGSIEIDGLALPEPPPRNAPPSVRADDDEERLRRVARPTVQASRASGASLNPGSPVYIQLIDADLDVSGKVDTTIVEVVAQGGGKDNVVKVKLTETGPRTGVFVGSVATASSGPTITASSEAVGHPASSAMDVDRNSPAATTNPSTRPAARALTFWQARPTDKTPYIEIDLHQAASLSKLVWGAGDDPLAGKNMPSEITVTLKGDGPERVIKLTNQSQPSNNTVDLKGTLARTIRIDIGKWRGDAPAIGQIIITDVQGNQLLPSEDVTAEIDRESVLQFNVGQTVFARYMDEFNETPGTAVVRQSRKLGARYHNATMALVKQGLADENRISFSPAWRLNLDAAPSILLDDADLDTSTKADTARLDVFVESGDSQSIDLTETGPSTGAFIAPLTMSINPAAKDNPRVLMVLPGDAVWTRSVDERNMTPGYKTFRYNYFLENRPAAGDWSAFNLRMTAWPFEVKSTNEEVEAPVGTRSLGKGRIALSIHDADAMSTAASGANAKVNALLSGGAQELVMGCTGPGAAAHSLDLVLGDTQGERRSDDPGNANASALELVVPGDEVIRLSYTDVKVPTADLHVRPVFLDPAATQGRGAPKAAPKAENEVTPLIRLADPNRRVTAAQDKRLAALREELAVRLFAYTADRKLLDERRETLTKRLGALPKTAPATSPSADGAVSEADMVRNAVASLAAQIDLLDKRVDRIKRLGGKEAKAPVVVQAVAAAEAVVGKKDPAAAPIVAGEPFEIEIDDPDLQGPAVQVRVRSMAGRLIGKLMVAAKRDASGKYLAKVPTTSSDDPEQSGAISVVPGGDIIVDYQDTTQAAPQNVERVAYLAMASDATFAATNAGYYDTISSFRLGEAIHIQVIDFDADRSPGIDLIAVTAKTSTGDRMVVVLSETEPHSGIFRAKIQTDNATPNPADDILQANYGGSIDLTYGDYLRQSLDQPVEKVIKLAVSGGADGIVEGFSRQFKDAQEEMKLWYRTGQSAYQIGRKLYQNGSYERSAEYLGEATDYFAQLVSRFPADPLAASANYYVGNIQSLKGNHNEALARYQEVVTRWPKSDFVARARFKIGQELESLGRFEQAADAYVLLTYHHPEDEHVPMAMLRMINHFSRSEQFADATAIAQKFVEKFPKHPRAGSVAVTAGQFLIVSSKGSEAVAWYVQAEKQFATSDVDMPALLYWHAAAMIHIQVNPRAGRGGGVSRPEKIRELLNRVIYDYPKSPYVNLARQAMESVIDTR